MDGSHSSNRGRPGGILWLVKWLLLAALAVAVLMLLLGDETATSARISGTMAMDAGVDMMPGHDTSSAMQP